MKKIFTILLLALTLVPVICSAQENKFYIYDQIKYTAVVNRDGSTRVQEEQSFNFKGQYNKAYRNIDLDKGNIYNVNVIDADTGEPLVYSKLQLDKTKPSSWGKYTTYYSNNQIYIEWYYNLKDTRKTWVIEYTISPEGLTYYGNAVDFYRDIAGTYSTNINKLIINISGSNVQFNTENSIASLYLKSSGTKIESQSLDGAYTAELSSVTPNSAVTVAVQIPNENFYPDVIESVVSDYRKDVYNILYLLLAGILLSLLIWYFKEGKNKYGRTIYAEYDLPDEITPVVADIVLNEAITNKGWAASLINLVVKKEIVVEKQPEDEKKIFAWFSAILIIVVLITFLIISALALSQVRVLSYLFTYIPKQLASGYWYDFVVSVPIYFAIFWLVSRLFKKGFWMEILKIRSKFNRFVLLKTSKYKEDSEVFDNKYYDTLCDSGGVVDTKHLTETGNIGRFKKIRSLEKKTLKAVSKEIGYTMGLWSYKVNSTVQTTFLLIIIFAFIYFENLLKFGQTPLNTDPEYWYFLNISFVACIVLKAIFNPSLNEEGLKVKDKILGLKMYIDKVDRPRIKNIDPKDFEKLLPYAIVFGIEKKWAHNFEMICKETDYVPMTYANGYYGLNSHAFIGSVSNFTTSFQSSISAIGYGSSSGFGGGGFSSGGGGGAGGGGGGGGGGAS